jgi:hypothetical protein
MKTCVCGCGMTFEDNPRRKYYNEACRKRVTYSKKKKHREKRANEIVSCGCGCEEEFRRGSKGRKYYNGACRARVALAKKNAKNNPNKILNRQACRVCGKKFTPRSHRHVTCSSLCKDEYRRIKEESQKKHQIPATHKSCKAEWDGIVRDDDFTHRKYLEYSRMTKKKNGRVCMAEGCNVKCVGTYYFCERCREQNYRKAAYHGFMELEGL